MVIGTVVISHDVQIELAKWFLYVAVPVISGYIGKFFATQKALRKYEKYLPVAQEIVQSAGVICLASNEEKSAMAISIIKKRLTLSTSAADYLVKKAYVLYKDELDKIQK